MGVLKEVQELVEDKGMVNVELIMEHFGVDSAKACRILQACWNKGKISPVRQAYFAQPTEDGSAPVWTKGMVGPSVGLKRRESWFAKEIELVLDYMNADPDEGKGIFDLTAVPTLQEIALPSLRKVMKLLVERGDLKKMQADAGGAFGHKPDIYGFTEQALQRRNQRYIETAPVKKAATRAKVIAGRKAKKDLKFTPITRVDFREEER